MEVKPIEFEGLGQHWGSCQRRSGWHNIIPNYPASCPCCEEPPSCPICKKRVAHKGKGSGLEQSLDGKGKGSEKGLPPAAKGKAAKGHQGKGSGLEQSLDGKGKGSESALPQAAKGKGKGQWWRQEKGTGLNHSLGLECF